MRELDGKIKAAPVTASGLPNAADTDSAAALKQRDAGAVPDMVSAALRSATAKAR
jgi:hypothetical protein